MCAVSLVEIQEGPDPHWAQEGLRARGRIHCRMNSPAECMGPEGTRRNPGDGTELGQVLG